VTNKKEETLRERVQKALLQEAIVRPESALVISITLLLAVFAPQISFLEFIPFWIWLLGGALAEGALIYSSLSDPEFGRKVAAKELRREFHPENLSDRQLQQRVNEALDYRSRIEKTIREQDDSMVRYELSETAAQIDAWLEHIYSLAQRIDRYQQERDVLERDRDRTEIRIKELEALLTREDDESIKDQITSTLESKERQLATLKKLADTIQRAELQLESSHALLATIYSQTMLVDAKDIDSGRSRRLRQEISDEVDELQDMLLAMDEVHTPQSLP
jgi:chromosome segregation ATPase